MLSYRTASQAYLDTLWRLLDKPDCHTAPRGLACYELLDHGIRIEEPDARALETRDVERNAVMAEYLRREFELYHNRAYHVRDFARASAFWKQIANPDGTVNSAYGHLIWGLPSCGHPTFEGGMRTPWQWALESLRRDTETRQAYVRFSLPIHQWMGNRDQVCTMHGQFLVRRGRLNFTVVMRSNDIVRGFPYDVPFFCSLLGLMAEELRMEVGYYGHFVHSLHLYDRDRATARRMLGIHDAVEEGGA